MENLTCPNIFYTELTGYSKSRQYDIVGYCEGCGDEIHDYEPYCYIMLEKHIRLIHDNICCIADCVRSEAGDETLAQWAKESEVTI